MILVWLAACNRRSTVGSLFAGLSPHERYEQSLRRAALDQTALGTSWLLAAEASLRDTLTVALPFREVGYFVADRPRAAAFRYAVRAGQRIRVAVRSPSFASFFLDAFKVTTDTTLEAVASADSTLQLSYDVERDGVHHLRLQPELLQDASYELTIEIAPSLGFPVAGYNSRAVGSFYGAPRDGGARSHRGVDIFAPRGTPVVAASAGVVSARTSSRRGGKVVWLKARGTNQYYAHLDSQAVRPTQRVRAGDTLGWVGNTGNARTTPPHLHFGVYRFGQGAVDPFPFIDNAAPEPPTVDTDTALLKRPGRVSALAANLRTAPTTRSMVVGTYGQHTLLHLLGTTGKWFRVALPSGQRGYVHESLVGSTEEAVAKVTVPRAARWYWTVDESASDEAASDARVFHLDLVGTTVPVLARYDSLLWVEAAPGLRMWLPEPT
jgi:murein DD-endopeptidase MepM/ murein hydrolase activator NlpD